MYIINHQVNYYIKYPKYFDQWTFTLFFYKTLKLDVDEILSGLCYNE